MKIVLGRKQKYTSDELWQDAVAHIEQLISADECETFAAAAINRITDAAAGKNAGYAWSGGKDSLVLADLCQRAGVTQSALFLTKLEFPAFESWLLENKPDGCEVLRFDFDLDYLTAHPELIFPKGKEMQRWNVIMQRRSQITYYRKRNLEILLTGHRRIDGNGCGREGFTRRKSGETIYAPLYDWPHEAVLGYIHYHGIPMPPIYNWPRGYRNGTHFWPYRSCDSRADGWREVYQIDPSVVEVAAGKLPEAKAFLEGVRS